MLSTIISKVLNMGVVSWMMADASASVSNIPFLLLEPEGNGLFFNLTREGKKIIRKKKNKILKSIAGTTSR